MITRDRYLTIAVSDVMSAAHGNTNVSMEGAHVETGALTQQSAPPHVLMSPACSFYSAAMGQAEPDSQFILLWAVVELLTNTVAGEPLLDEADIEKAIDVLSPADQLRERMAGALRGVRGTSFREKISQSFMNVFGACELGVDRKLGKLRSVRGKLVHPVDRFRRSDAKLVDSLTQLRELLEHHFSFARKREVVAEANGRVEAPE